MEAVVKQEIFDQVQQINIKRQEKFFSVQGKYGSTENIIQGLLICADCGSKMKRLKRISKAGTMKYIFACRIYIENLGVRGCDRKYIAEADLHEAVFHALHVQIKLGADFIKILNKGSIYDSFNQECKKFEEDIRRVQQKIRRNKTLRSLLFESYCEQLLSETEYRSMKEDSHREAHRQKEELLRLKQERYKHMMDLPLQSQRFLSPEKCQKESTMTRNMIKALIYNIRVLGSGELEIVWNFRDIFIHFIAQEAQVQI